MGNVKIEFEWEDKEKEEIRVFKAEAQVKYSYESNYGADADNNRGVPMWFIDDVDIESLKEVMEDGSEVDADYDKLPKELQKEIDDRINEAEPESNEPDYDDREDY